MKNIKRNLFCLLLFVSYGAIASDSVDPAMLVVTNIRDRVSDELASSTPYFRGDSIRFTNCVMYAGSSTNSARQGLSNVTISVTIGIEASTNNQTFAGTVQNATSGLWACDATIPTNWPVVLLEISITDSLTNSFTYPHMKLNTKEKL